MKSKVRRWPWSILAWSLAGWAVGLMFLGLFNSNEEYYDSSYSSRTPYTYTENYDKDLTGDYSSDNQDNKKDRQGSQDVSSTQYEAVSINDLLDELDANALRAEQTYNGKYIEFSGKLSNIDSSGKYISVCKINDDWGLESVHCSITDQSQLDFIAGINKGDTVTIRGEVTDVGELLGYFVDIHEIG